MNIKNSTVLLIGATGGIGRKITEALWRSGAGLILVGRNESGLEHLCSVLPCGQGKHLQTVAADISTAAGRNRIVNAVEASPHGIDVVINCAGINYFSVFDELDQASIQALIDINLTAPLQLIRLLIPKLMDRKHAQILNVGSTFGSIGFAGFSVYCATKFALRGFSEALGRELADTPVRVSYVAPRATVTELNTSDICAMNRELGVAMDNPEKVADKILETLQSGRTQVFIGWPERFFVKLNSLFPQLVDLALRKNLPVIKRYASHKQYSN